MRASTEAYVRLQKMYKARAEEEGAVFSELLLRKGDGELDKENVDTFLKNCHALKVLKGKKWGVFDSDREALSEPCFLFVFLSFWCVLKLTCATATALQTYPKETATHLALSALSSFPADVTPTVESLRAAVQSMVGQDVDLPEELDNAVGEMCVMSRFPLTLPSPSNRCIYFTHAVHDRPLRTSPPQLPSSGG